MNYARATFCAAALAFLCACGSEPEPAANAAASAPPPPPPAAAAKPAPKDPAANMARAVGNGKPGAAVDIRYEFLDKPAVGTPVELEIVFIPSVGVDALDATIGGMDGVTLAGNLQASFAEVEAGKPYKHTVSLLPDRAGIFYISVSANTHIGGQRLGRTFSIPFVVGEPPVQRKPAPQRDASGEAIEPMKAEETTGPGQ